MTTTVYTIKRASELLGVPEATLRTWERRYGLGATGRSSSGYRLYDDSALARLSHMQRLVTDGWTASQAADSTRRAYPVEQTPQAQAADVAWSAPPLAGGTPEGRLRAAANAFDARSLDATLDDRFSSAAFEHVVDQWLLPSLRDLGEAWESGEVSVAGEHFVSHAVSRRLAAGYDAAGQSPGGPGVVVGLPPGSRHELGLLAFAAAARRAGIATTYLGADVPVPDWGAAVRPTTVAAAVLSIPMEGDASAAAEASAAIRAARPDLVVAVGGAHQDLAPRDCFRLGHQIGDAATRLAGLLRSLPQDDRSVATSR